MKTPVPVPLPTCIAAALATLLSGGLPAQTTVTATATVQRMTATTQLAGSAPVTTSVTPGTAITGAVETNQYGGAVARGAAAFDGGAAAIELRLDQLAFAFGVGNSASFDTRIAITYTSNAALTCGIEIETLSSSGPAIANTGVDVNGDGILDLVPGGAGTVRRLNLPVNGVLPVVLESRGGTNTAGGGASIVSHRLVVRLVASPRAGQIQPLLAPCSSFELDAAPTFSGGVALQTSRVPGSSDLMLVVFGFQPVFASLALAPSCFWTPSADITVQLPPGQPELVLDSPALAGAQLFTQAAWFRPTSSLAPAQFTVSGSYRLTF